MNGSPRSTRAVRIDVARNGKPWLTNQPNTDAVWSRIRTRAHAGDEITTRPHVSAFAPTPKPPVVPPTSPLAVEAQSAVVWAAITDDALAHADALRPPWRHWISADPGVYASWFADGWHPNITDVIPKLRPIVARLRQHGCPVQSWCDCRTPPDGTSAQAAIDLARTLNLDGWVGQAEDPGELEHSVGIHSDGGLVAPQGSERAKVIVGNPNAWTQKQRDTATKIVGAGDLAVAGEVYNGRPDTYSSQGVPVASFCLGVAMDNNLRYPLDELLAKTPVGARSTYGVWHGAGLLPADWKAMLS